MSATTVLLSFRPGTDSGTLDAWLAHLEAHGEQVQLVMLGGTPVVLTSGVPETPPGLPQPVATVVAPDEFRLGRRPLRPAGTTVEIGPTTVGDGAIAVFAGPCAVENRDQLLATAAAAAEYGSVGLRGGAFKPRTSPYSFQGLHWAGLELLAEAREQIGLPVLTEIVDPAHVERAAPYVDAFQIGARNMQNFALLTEVGRSGMPVVLKRGFGCTVDELLQAGEYILAEGNDRLILCERGIRTFDRSMRFTLDLSAVALLKRLTHLPVMVDPSHSVGIPELVEPMALGAAAVGADALLIDIHVAPTEALCDGKQALRPEEFATLMERLEMLAIGVGRKLASRTGRG